MDSNSLVSRRARRRPRHRLGPHVVGTRVVVRRIVRGGGASGDEPETGPTGGPAFTDLLGTCTAWGAETCTIARSGASGRDRAARHRLGQAGATSRVGAPAGLGPRGPRATPSRPSRRRAPRPGRVGGPQRPMPVGRPFKRANSCLAWVTPACRWAEALTGSVEAFYAERDRPPLLQVEGRRTGRGRRARRGLGGGCCRTGRSSSGSARLAAVRRRRRALAPPSTAPTSRSPASGRSRWSRPRRAASPRAAPSSTATGWAARAQGPPRAPPPGPGRRGDGRAAGVGRRARGEHRVAARRDRQRARPRPSTTAWACSPSTSRATSSRPGSPRGRATASPAAVRAAGPEPGHDSRRKSRSLATVIGVHHSRITTSTRVRR